MARTNPDESGVLPGPDATLRVPEDLARACHDILGALAALTINVEILAEARTQVDGELQQVVHDARDSVDRIARIAKALQRAVRSRAAA
ncbi:MAG TPA: hypothetical protein VIF15_02775 [Polyangiaceae bacterium]|jgi:hypothetical protein